MVKGVLIIGFFLSGVKLSFAQDIQSMMASAQDYHHAILQEKLYLHLDKPSYTVGETIWMKAYATVGIHNLLSNLSGLAYIELIAPKEQIVAAIKIPLVMGLGVADIPLSDTLTEGSYRLRAYTNWMRNAEPEFFYDRTLPIANGLGDNWLTTTTLRSGEAQDTYEVNIQTMEGMPLRYTRLNVALVQGGKVLRRKTVRTDAEGRADIPVDRRYRDAQVRYTFETSEKETVSKVFSIIDAEKQHSVQVFAEGGKLISNRPNQVAVKALNQQGLGVQAKVVFLSGQDTVATIRTNPLGMGASSLFPLPNKSLTATVEYANGVQQEVLLPPVHDSGYSLQVNSQLQGRLVAQLHLSDELLDGKDIYFLVQHLGKIFVASKQKVSTRQITFSGGTDELPNGVLTVTVLNHQLKPIAERPFFHYNPDKQLPLSLELDKTRYGRRQKVQVSVNMEVASDSVRIGAFSASVVHWGKVDTTLYDEAPDMLSALLLHADIKGFVENPGYYFQDGQVKRQDIDYLMLTQGWRNINWEEVGQVRQPEFEVEKGVKISGYTRKFGRSAPEPNAVVQLFPSKSLLEYVETTSDENGYFEFNHLLFPDSVDFVVSVRDRNGKDRIDIHVLEQEPPSIGKNRNKPLERHDVNALLADQIQHAKRYFHELHRIGMLDGAIVIDEVLVRRKLNKASPRSSNRNGPGNADYVFATDDLASYQNLEQFFAGRTIGIEWDPREGMPLRSLFILDGQPLENERAAMLDFSRLESVEVLCSETFTMAYSTFLGLYSSGGGERKVINPVIFILTSRFGDDVFNRKTIPKGILTLNTKGLYAEREFYKPNYDVANTALPHQDLRTTIHWEPSVVISKSGTASFDFYTSDEPGTYRIILEGIDVHGRLGRKVLDFTVQ